MPKTTKEGASVMARILYIEEEGLAGYLKARLGISHEVILVSTIEEAQKAIHEAQFDLILVEPILPATNTDQYLMTATGDKFAGLVFLRGLLSDPNHPPVVIASAWGPLDLREFQAGAAHIFAKPYDNDELVRSVEETLAG